MTAKPITIANVPYATRSAAECHLSALLAASSDFDDEITDPKDTELLSELFHARTAKVSELAGRNIVGWGRQKTTVGQCFAALLDTGEKLHFSYPKSLDALYEAPERRA